MSTRPGGRNAASTRTPLRAALQRLYVHLTAAVWRVNLGSVFDAAFYRASYPDVAASGMDPAFHYLRFGAAEGRFPNPLFDTAYYLARYPDVARSGRNPLLHFLCFGGVEGRSPHREFDSEWYLRVYPDVAAARVNPLAHFLAFGAAEGRLPGPEFDATFYLAANPAAAQSGFLPPLHFARIGAAQGLAAVRPASSKASPEQYLPAEDPAPAAPPGCAVDVVMPVYRGLQETIAAIGSVLASGGAVKRRLIVVNDCSPEPELVERLRALAATGAITLLENEQNLGFVRSVNRGMAASENDVALLNNDTLVFRDWLDRLAACAYAEERVGTVTPFSNNATICSYPEICEDNPLPPGATAEELDALFASVNRGRLAAIPTGVGFCMYIRRDCLRETGEFDAETFGRGYGEENDFCMRAAALGWRHLLACDVFVFHAGSVSFGSAAEARAAAGQTLAALHPGYAELVRRHCQEDPAQPYRIAVTAQRISRSGRRVLLSVQHHLGGGVARHALDVARATEAGALWLHLRPAPPGEASLSCAEPGFAFQLTLAPEGEMERLAAVLRACGVERIHIHHAMGHGRYLRRLVEELGLPFDFTVHDYFTVCPQVSLSGPDGAYCGEPAESGCNRCLNKRPVIPPADISAWRNEHAWLVEQAARVLAPSADVAARIRRYFPAAPVIAAYHPGPPAVAPVARPLEASQPLRVAVLGAMTTHKGLALLRACSAAAEKRGLPLRFSLIGGVERDVAERQYAFTQTGPYAPEAMATLIANHSPHLVWFPARCPETFSYTLSACLELGLPAAAHAIGSFPERLGGRDWSWLLPADSTADDWTAWFLRVRHEHFIPGAAPTPPPPLPRAISGFYPDAYLQG